MDGILNLVNQLKARWNGLSFNQRVLLSAVAVASVISVTVFSVWLQHEEKAVLFANLTPEDASAALEELAKQDVEAELSNGGATILVPENQVHRLRVDLAAKGVPSAGVVGFEIFDGKQYGLTEFLQNVNFKRATEGELVKTIEGLQGIQSARVHLSLSKPSMFSALSSEATASVALRTGRGMRLADSQIAGIQSLVASSVENLEPENVIIVDQHGKTLSSRAGDEDAGQGQTQLALQREVESHLAQKASAMLDEALGSGRSIVQVAATLNFEKIDRQSEVFDPKTVVRSEERTEKNNPNEGTDENSITNYEINRTVEHVIGQTGGVKALSVSVFVDGHYEQGGEGGEPVYTPLSDEELDNLKRIVQTAVGLNTMRGDQIEVVNMQFRQDDETGSAGGPAPDWLGLVTQYGGRAFLMILLAVLALSMKSRLGKLVSEAFAPAGGVNPTTGRPYNRQTGGVSTLEQDEEHFDGIPDLNDKVISEIQEYASENPERVAEVMLSWIHGIDLGEQKMKAES